MNGDGGAKPVLEAVKVAKLYGAKLVFKNVSCAVAPGRTLIVAGANGAGKSTLLKIMAGLSRATAGRVDVACGPEQVAYLGHATFIYPGLTAVRNLAFWAKMYGLSPSRDELLALLERVGLARAAEEKAGSFSRGMSQRLNLARIFLVRPRLVFLDEPGTGLDAPSMALLRREITGLRDQGAAVVWISHQLHEDAALADEVLFLESGKAGYYGPAADFPMERIAC